MKKHCPSTCDFCYGTLGLFWDLGWGLHRGRRKRWHRQDLNFTLVMQLQAAQQRWCLVHLSGDPGLERGIMEHLWGGT